MDEQEENRSTTTQSSSQSTSDDNNRSKPVPFPLEVTFKILSRLPTKSVVRFRSVSKLWAYITTTPLFTKARSSASRPCVLLTFRKYDILAVFSSPLRNNTSSHVGNYRLPIPDYGFLPRFESVHGLVCLEAPTQLVIWNPTLKRLFTLPEAKSSECNYKRGFLGYDPVDGTYKALCILTGRDSRILTLGAQESWRTTTNDSSKPVHWPTKDCGRCINGVIYYRANLSFRPLKQVVMSFDLRSEKFLPIEFPMPDHDRCLMVSYEGKLGLVSSVSSGVGIWSLENAENQEWSYRKFLLPPIYQTWDLKGVTDDGEAIYVPSSFEDSFYVVYFDLKSKSVRETKIQAIGRDDVWRPDRLGCDLINDFCVLPNHIESFMSL
ncbi:unnamed protein product [Microthlaspi erraticum]|uniref:F-box domain-containing protein n=1 Tax=Microthlaspi erraticum TaxID=1685480 RepID=A0A6D2L468_9BRAS|nr:unnamed protein product [Microthlaspi erraticum]